MIKAIDSNMRMKVHKRWLCQLLLTTLLTLTLLAVAWDEDGIWEGSITFYD